MMKETSETKSYTIEELIELKEAVPYMDGDSWFANATPKLIENLIHYETVIKELKNWYEHMEDWSGQDGHDSRLIMEMVRRFKLQ